jgi:hypothetical protein
MKCVLPFDVPPVLMNVTESSMPARTAKAHLGRLVELAFDGSNVASEGFATTGFPTP